MSPSVEPFDEVKYKALMDGLKCSEILLGYVREKLFRVDAEYYQKSNLLLENILEAMAGKTISEYAGRTDCSAFYPSITCYYSDNRNNIPFLRVNEIVDGLVVISDKTVFLPEEVLKANSNTIALAYPGDIIIAKGGNTLAKVGLVTGEYAFYATCRDVIILRTNDMANLNKFYLWAFLHCSFGQRLMWRSASQTGQPHLTLKSIDGIHIPEYSIVFQSAIEKLYKQSVFTKNKSQCKYDEANDLIEQIIGKIQVNNRNISIKMFSNSFLSAGRLDAEYYQEKYHLYESVIQFSALGYTHIKNVFLQVKEKCLRDLPYYNYVEIGDVNIDTGNAIFNVLSTEQLPDNAKIMTKQGDLLVSTVRPNRGAIAILEANNLLVSGAFTVLRETGMYPKEVLQVLLRTSIYKDWLLRFNVGTSYPVIKDENVLEMPIPLFEEAVERDIVRKVKEASSLRYQSKLLLEYAKQSVEIAIEQGEDAALAWLKNKVE